MTYEMKITSKAGVYLKTDRALTRKQAEITRQRLEAKGCSVEITEVVASPPSSGSHPTAMYSGDPGVRSSIRAEMSGPTERTWELSEEERYDIAEDGE